MDPNNFVGQQGGGYDVYVKGQYKGTYADKDTAEQMFNYLNGGPSLNQGGDMGTSATTQNNSGYNPGSFGPSQAGFNVVGGQGQLGPVLTLAQMAQQQNQWEKGVLPASQWQTALNAANLAGWMPGSYGKISSRPLEDPEAYAGIWANRPDLKSFYEKNAWKVGTPDEQAKAVQNWMTIDPRWAGQTPQQVAKSLGVQRDPWLAARDVIGGYF